MKVERVVFDTNVLISAQLSELGKPFACLCWVRAKATMITAAPLLEDLLTRLSRPKFRKYRTMSEVEDFVDALAATETVVTIKGLVRACRDPNDDMFLEAALAGRADVIITGDEDLLVLDPFESVRIVTPAAFLALVGA
jgi:putative PIN family toxin of toxin-antitoxin system